MVILQNKQKTSTCNICVCLCCDHFMQDDTMNTMEHLTRLGKNNLSCKQYHVGTLFKHVFRVISTWFLQNN